jgi:hypothetical protein
MRGFKIIFLLMITKSVFPSLAKSKICIGRGQGRFFKKLFIYFPLAKGGDFKGELFISVYKPGYSSSFFIKTLLPLRLKDI